MTEQSFDHARSEAFAERMMDILNGAGTTLMTSIGHQVGLFDAMADLPPATSQQIAEAAGLQERYVREWLGAMLTGGVVDYDPADGTYALPAEHAAWLTRAAGTDNLAVQAQFIPLLAQVEQPVIECFRNGGGVPYAAFPRFQQLMAEDSGRTHDAVLIDTILPLAPDLPARLESGIDVADVGCGSGHAINLMAQAFPNSRFVGFDFSEEGTWAGRDEAQRLRLTNARFEARDVSALGAREQFDLITAFDAIHDQIDPAGVLRRIRAALAPGGVFLMLDVHASSDLAENVDAPMTAFLYTISTMHCMTVSLAHGGAGLGTAWGTQLAVRMLREAGFGDVTVVERVDPTNSLYVAR
jgi:SAM-dependent methyltransferase